MTRISVHWFRKALRLHDNPALLAAMKDCVEVYPIFILDPWFPKNMRVSVNRWRFLVESLSDLDESLKKLSLRLFIVRGCPAEVFPRLFKEWKVTHLTFEVDTEPYARQRDAEVVRLAADHGVQVIQKVSHTLYDTERIIIESNGRPPLTYTQFQRVLSTLGPPKKPVPAPTLENLKDCNTPVKDDHDMEYGIPSFEELGQDLEKAGPHLYRGGESEALARLDLHMKRTLWVCNFEKPATSPNSLTPSTTVLSPYIKFGCLSVRTFWWKLTEIYQGRKHSNPPVSLHGQLLWREFFYTAGAGIPNFNKMEGNPICVQVDWDENKEYLKAWSEGMLREDLRKTWQRAPMLNCPNEEKWLQCMKLSHNLRVLLHYGQTGYPFIDAIMMQLRTEGWIHHLARHAVACFLTRGDLWISWEEGQKVFEDFLLDADWSLNAGNWLWLSASAFFHQFFRVYSPVAFGKKTDKNGDYIKKYLPVLQKFPSDYIYEPWKAPRSIQERAGCIIGKDYPKPIVVHEVVRKRNLERMKAAYARPSQNIDAQPQDETSKKEVNQKRQMASSKAKEWTKKAKMKRS